MRRESVELNVEEQTVRGNFFIPQGPVEKVAVLFLHGWTGKPNEKAAELLAKNGFYALTIAMRGHIPSDGDIHEVTTQNGLDDAIAGYDYLLGRVPDGTQIVVVGNSYGGFLAVLLSTKRSLVGMSLRVPANYPDENLNQKHWGRGSINPATMQWRRKPHTFSENEALKAVHDFAGFIQILEAEHDDIIPPQTVRNYVESVQDANKLEYILLKEWPHSMGDDPLRNAQLQQLYLTWIKQIKEKV